MDLATIRAWIGQGRVTPHTSLIEPLSGRVIIAGQCMDLQGAFPPSSPPVSSYPPQGPVGLPTYAPSQGTPYSGYSAPASASPSNWYTFYTPAPVGMVPMSPRSKVVAILLAFFLWPLGIHRFYLGYSGIGVLILLTTIVCGCFYIPFFVWGVLALVDIILIATGGLRDAEGRPLSG